MSEKPDFHHRLLSGLSRLLAATGQEVKLIETHISSVLLAGGYAYKIKKSLDLGFLDFSTLERRRFCCQEEVRLNRRLAPDIYLGVETITGVPEQPVLGGEGAVIEYAVRMRRFSQEGLLSNRSDALTPALADAIARRLARFHSVIERADREQSFGEPEQVLFPMIQNFQQIRPLVGDGVSDRLDRLEAWTRQRYQALEAILIRRKAEGCIRECHGDLHLGNIAVEGERLIIFDGIEFNPDLRWIDTMNELAFLLMDLDGRGYPELAQRLLNVYLEISGDFGGLSVIRFYQVYRAMVRAKVAAIRLNQPGLEAVEQQSLKQEFFSYMEQADGYTRPMSPALLISHGLSGSGKSTVAGDLMQAMLAVRLRSDVERKRLAGLASSADSGSATGAGIYTPAFSQRTYEHLLTLAEVILDAGYIPIVDATFLKEPQRRPFRRLAEERGIPFLILDFQVPEAELRRRVTDRQAQGRDASEANIGVLEQQLKGEELLTGDEAEQALTITPEQPLSMDVLRSRLV